MRQTSFDAYASVRDQLSAMQAKLLDALRGTKDGATADQLADMTGLSWHTARKRMSEIAKAGYCEDSGKRAVNQSRRQAIVWVSKQPEAKL